jgi:molybdopterin synthase sulfur carrier subunit
MQQLSNANGANGRQAGAASTQASGVELRTDARAVSAAPQTETNGGTLTLTLTVRLFGRARELAGTDHVELVLSGPVNVGKVRAALLDRHPPLQPLAQRLFAAVNADYAADDRVLTDGCEVAFFPPVSGG